MVCRVISKVRHKILYILHSASKTLLSITFGSMIHLLGLDERVELLGKVDFRGGERVVITLTPSSGE